MLLIFLKFLIANCLCQAEAIGVNPLYMLVPTALCVSFSFLLPVSNPPNAIVFTYGHLTSMDMVSAFTSSLIVEFLMSEVIHYAYSILNALCGLLVISGEGRPGCQRYRHSFSPVGSYNMGNTSS